MDEGDTIESDKTDTWKLCNNALREYKNKYGDCLVKHKYQKKEKKLGNWVQTQRLRYKTHMNRECITYSRIFALSTEQLRLLRDVGFVLSVDEYRWKARYQELEQYKVRTEIVWFQSSTRKIKNLHYGFRLNESDIKPEIWCLVRHSCYIYLDS